MKKFLTIALLVMALCVVSVAVSADGGKSSVVTATYDGEVATVSAPTTSAGQAVVLVVKNGEKELLDKDTDLIVNTDEAAKALAENIIYVDQTTATAGGTATFKFIPRDNYADKSTVFFSDGTTVSTELLDTTPVTSHTVTFDTAGGDAITAVTVKSNETLDLTKYVPTRVGFKFKEWKINGVVETSIVEPKEDKTVVAVWEAYFNETPAGDDVIVEDKTDNEGNGVADAVLNEDGSYKMSVTTKVGTALKQKTLTEYGFYIYNKAMSKVIVAKNNAATNPLGDNDGFYAIINSVAAAYANEEVYFKPFAIDNTNTTFWGTGAFYKAADLAK